MTKCISVISFKGIDFRRSQTMPCPSGILELPHRPCHRVWRNVLHKPEAPHFKYNISNDYSDYNTLTIIEKDDCRAISHFLKSTIWI